MQKITPCLWFDNNAEEAANFYTSIFKNSKIVNTTHYGEDAHKPKGTVMTVSFQLEGQDFVALNGGPEFTFTPALSLFVNCNTQQELNELWDKLSAGGEKQQCGWLKDQYGVSWQIVPACLSEMIQDSDSEKLHRLMQAVWKMDKLDADTLVRAYSGRG